MSIFPPSLQVFRLTAGTFLNYGKIWAILQSTYLDPGFFVLLRKKECGPKFSCLATGQAWVLDSEFDGRINTHLSRRIYTFSEAELPHSPAGTRLAKTVLDSWFQVLDTGFFSSVIQRNLDSGFQSIVGFRIPWAVFRIPMPSFRFPQAKISWISESGFPWVPLKIDFETSICVKVKSQLIPE